MFHWAWSGEGIFLDALVQLPDHSHSRKSPDLTAMSCRLCHPLPFLVSLISCSLGYTPPGPPTLPPHTHACHHSWWFHYLQRWPSQHIDLTVPWPLPSVILFSTLGKWREITFSLDQSDSSRGGKKWTDLGYNLKIEPKDLMRDWNVEELYEGQCGWSM